MFSPVPSMPVAFCSGAANTRRERLGNALAKVRSKDKVKVLTIRSTAFPPSTAEKKGESAISIIDASSLLGDSVRIPEWIGEEVNAKGGGRPELADAKRIVSGGRALQSGDNFQILYQLADKLGAAGISPALSLVNEGGG